MSMQANKTQTVDLVSGDPRKKIIRFALPLLVGNLFQEFYNMVDMLVVGKFEGASALAAVGAAGVPFMLINAVTIGFSVGATILIGQYFGAKKVNKLRQISGTVLIMTVLMGLVTTGLNFVVCRPLLKLLNVTDTLIDDSYLYLCTIGCFLCPMMLYNNASGMLRGIGNSKMPIVFLAICTLINTALDLLFVIVFRMGVFGVALATGIAQLISAVLVLGYIYLYVPELKPQKGELRINGEILRKTIRLGLPNAIQTGTVMLGVMVLQRIINSFGDAVIAAYSVGAKINTFAQMPIMSMASTISAFSAQNLGASKPERVSVGISFTLKVTLGITAILSILIICFRHELIGIFTTAADTDVVLIGGQYLMIYSTMFIALAAMNVFQGALNGAGDTLFTMGVSIAMTFLRVPLAHLLIDAFHMDYRGAWLTFPITWCVAVLLITVRYRGGKWKNKILSRDGTETRYPTEA